jgi:eukaryotic-like serine/threonine-protein kinase
VPSLEGLSLEEARDRIREARLKLDVRQQYDDTVAEGRVISQSPPPEAPLEVGQPVELVVSRGPEPISVPRVVGLSEDEAAATLRGEDLDVRVIEEFSATVPKGDVISQSPRAFQNVDPGSTVTIVVSLGPREFPMPSVIGDSEPEARAELEGLGLVVSSVQVPGTTGDQVVGQRPDRGTIVRQGQTVRIFLGNPN